MSVTVTSGAVDTTIEDVDVAPFLTNHSGIGGDHLEPTIGEYDVELLNDLLVRVITQSLGIQG